MADGKGKLEHIQKAYDELVNEIEEKIQQKEKQYEELEVSRIKHEMTKDLAHYTGIKIENDDEFISETYFREEQVMNEIIKLKNNLEKCERLIKADWIK